MNLKKIVLVNLLATVIVMGGMGCSTTSSSKASPLTPTTGAGVDLSKYTVVTVLPFEGNSEKVKDPAVGTRLAKDIAQRLGHAYGTLFSEVHEGQPIGKPGELIVTGVVNNYVPGDRIARNSFGVIGAMVGAAQFSGELILKDGNNGPVLLTAPFDRLQSMPLIFTDMTRSIENIEVEVAAAAANTIARAKGWNPPTTPAQRSNLNYIEYVVDLPPLPAGEGRIWIYRPGAIKAAPIRWPVRVDGTAVGDIGSSETFHVETSSGAHEVVIAYDNRTFPTTIQVTANGNSYVKLTPKVGFTDWSILVEPTSEETALPAIRKLRVTHPYR